MSKVIALSIKDDASLIKFKNVIDMAIAFTAMSRVFEKGSKQKIAEKLESTLGLLAGVDGKDKFEKIHLEFCKWFIENIRTAHKVLKNKRIKKSHPASYGQAGKVFNVILKVCVYYCHYPDYQSSRKLIPLLHAAVDTKMMKYLKAKYQQEDIKAESIEAVTKAEYVTIQKMVNMDIEDKFENQIFPVHWDDMMWYRLNR